MSLSGTSCNDLAKPFYETERLGLLNPSFWFRKQWLSLESQIKCQMDFTSKWQQTEIDSMQCDTSIGNSILIWFSLLWPEHCLHAIDFLGLSFRFYKGFLSRKKWRLWFVSIPITPTIGACEVPWVWHLSCHSVPPSVWTTHSFQVIISIGKVRHWQIDLDWIRWGWGNSSQIWSKFIAGGFSCYLRLRWWRLNA